MTLTSPGLVALRVAVALCLAWVAGCESCHGARSDAPLATMLELRGDSARRDHKSSVEHWEHVDLRAKFWIGDGLRTDPPSSALLALADGAQLHVRTGTLIRFLADGLRDGEQGIDVVTGEAVLNSGTRDIRLRTHVGLATLTAGSQLVLTREGDQMRMRLDVGEAQFRDDHDRAVKLAIGEGVLLNMGMAKVQDSAAHVAAEPPPSAAIVAKVANDGVQTRDKGERAWRPLPRGDHALPAGTGLRLPAGTKVMLVRGKDSAELDGAGEYVLGDGSTWVEAQRGDVHVTALVQDIEVVVPGGRIIVHAADGGAEAGVRIADDAGTLEVARGHVTFKDKDGARDVATASPYHWSFAAAPASDATENSAAVDYENFEIAAGESFVVHAAEVPVALSIDFSHKCSDEGVVELLPGRQRSRGTGHSNVLFPVGGRSYAVRCLDAHAAVGGVVARGTAQVLRDAGTRKLPPIAPTSEIEADGRSYTIFYQNQLPNVHVRWPNAPATNRYQLEVDGTPMSVPSPEHVFQSGSLGDGVHHIDFEAQGRKSRTATVTVRFDNTAPTASLSSPADRGFAPGDSVDIEGVALPAWKVSVQGGTITKVGDDRFRGQVVTSQEHPDIAVRLVHPRLGTHYYLRRASGSR